MRRLTTIFLALSFVLLLTGHTKWGRDGSWGRADRAWGRIEEAVWTPNDLPSIIDRWDVDVGVTWSLVGADSAISSWTGRINGTDLAQGTGVNQPFLMAGQINGHPAVVFDGTNDYMQAAYGVYTQPLTVIIVCTEPDESVAFESLFDDITNGVSFTQRTGLNQYFAHAGASLVGGTISAGTWRIWTIVFNTTSSFWRRDGVEKASGDAGTRDMDGLTLGTNRTLARFSDISVTDLIVCDATLTTAEMQKVERWLNVSRGGIY